MYLIIRMLTSLYIKLLTNFIEEGGRYVVISLQVLKFPRRLLTVIEHDIRVSPEEFSNEEVVDDAAAGADGDVHVVGLLPEAVEVVVALTIRSLPRGLLRKPPPALLLPILRVLLAAGGGLRRSR